MPSVATTPGQPSPCPHPRCTLTLFCRMGLGCGPGVVGGGGKLPSVFRRTLSVIWPGESGLPDADSFDFDVSRITKSHKRRLRFGLKPCQHSLVPALSFFLERNTWEVKIPNTSWPWPARLSPAWPPSLIFCPHHAHTHSGPPGLLRLARLFTPPGLCHAVLPSQHLPYAWPAHALVHSSIETLLLQGRPP